MTAQSMFKIFEKLVPSMAVGVTHYGEVRGKKAIRMETTAGITLIFYYIDARHWRLETYEMSREQNKRHNDS